MSKFLLLTCFLINVLLSFNVLAYREDTHKKISKETLSLTILSGNIILKDLGLNSLNNKQNFSGYLDDKKVIPTISDYIQAGSDFEDEGVRSLNHFYDPYNNIGLKSWIGIKSPNWALEDDELDELPEQEYSLSDANNYLYRALSGKDPEGETKETNFGKLFRTIGHVIHHVQDMAQPQHVRDDDHCGAVGCSAVEFLDFFHPSLYEELSNDSRNDLIFTGYESVSYSKARDFWHNSNWSGMADFTNQNFISIGTNFIVNDAGNFFTNVNYPEPKPLNEITQPVRIEDVIDDPALKHLTGWMEFIPTMVTDRNLTGTSATFRNDEASTLSIFDQDLQLENACVQYTRKEHNDLTKKYTFETCRLFTYNRFNVKAAQKHLIPRAVAYSAGLINYFFRGRLDVTKTEQTTDTNGNAIIAITFKNTSTHNADMVNGELEFFYDALVDGVEVRKLMPLAEGESNHVAELKNGNEVTRYVLLPSDVNSDKENPFVVVYKGQIGEEQGVAGKVFKADYETALLAWKVSYTENINEYRADLHRSLDYGKTWINVTNQNFHVHLPWSPYIGVIKSLGTGKALALLAHFNASGDIVYKAISTNDNGKTWDSSENSVVSPTQYYYLFYAKNIQTETGNILLSTKQKAHKGNAGRYVSAGHVTTSYDDGNTWVVADTPIAGWDVRYYYPFIMNMGSAGVYTLGLNDDTRQYVSYHSLDYGVTWNEHTVLQGVNVGEYDYSRDYKGLYSYTSMSDSQQILTVDYTAFEPTFMVSNDIGLSWNHTFQVNHLSVTWPWMRPYMTAYLGQGKVIAYVHDGWSNYSFYFDGLAVSEDYGQSWKLVTSQTTPQLTYNETIIQLGVVSTDPALVGVIHSMAVD